MRTLYIVAPNTVVDDSVIASANGAEIVCGCPPSIAGQFPNPVYPFTYVETDDPELIPLNQAIQICVAYFNNPTPTNAQSVTALKALMRIVKRLSIDLRKQMG
jgi:hypothetical protein